MKHDEKFVYLDLLRGLAALVVFIFHLRILFFLRQSDMAPDQWAKQLDSLTPPAKIFYFLTSFGHEAVMVFFVLSGFFISRSVYNAHRDGRWSPMDYSLSRLSRLWTVLLPALLLTCVADITGTKIFPNAFCYMGSISGLIDHIPIHNISIPNFFGNMMFLNGITVPSLGSNGALWSLPFEFWYYVTFPMLFFVVSGWYSIPARLTILSLTLLIFVWLSKSNLAILQYFPVWMAGAVGMFARTLLKPASLLKNKWVTGLAWASITCLLALIRLSPYLGLTVNGWIFDYSLAAVVMLVIISQNERPAPEMIAKISRSISNVSFTLYVIHMPVACFICAWLAPSKLSFNFENFLLFLFVAALTFLIAVVFWICFERHTTKVKRFAGHLIPAPRHR